MAALIHRLGSDRLRQWLPLATLVMLVALIGALQPVFLQPATLLELAGDTAVLFILATGVTFVIMLGGIDLSIQSMASLASVVVAITLSSLGYWSFVLAVALGALAGLLSGLAHTRLRIPSFIATLAMGGVLFSTALVTSGEKSITLEASERGYLDLDHRRGLRHPERAGDRTDRARGGACPSGAYAVRPLQRRDRRRGASGLCLGGQGEPAEGDRLSCSRRGSPRLLG